MARFPLAWVGLALGLLGCAPNAQVVEHLYRQGDVSCRLTWTGRKTGWRLQSVAEGEEFRANGAVQALASFMDEPSPSAERPFSVAELGGRTVCRAADGTWVEIGADGRLDVYSSAGRLVTEGVGVVRQDGKTVLTGRLMDEEPVFGLGERLDRLNKRGQRIRLFTSDGYNDSNATYLVVPFFTTHRVGGVLVNLYEDMTADFGASEKNEWRIEADAQRMDAYLFAKDRMADALMAYADLSGHADVPERWNAGPIICRYYPDLARLEGPFVCRFNGMTLRGHGLREMMERHIELGAKPSAAIIEGGGYSDVWSDLKRREELRRMIAYLGAHDIKPMVYMRVGAVCGRTAPGFRPEYNVSISIATNGVIMQADTKFVPNRYSSGINPDNGRQAFETADITDPAFWNWYVNVVWRELVDLGVRGVKIDFCELLPEEGLNPGGVSVHYKWKNPSIFADAAVHHAYPTFFISKFYREMSKLTKDRGGFMVLSRGGGIGSQRNPYLWAGDQQRLFEKLDDQVLAMLNSGMSGVPFMTYDMGGYQYRDHVLEPDGEIDGTPVSVRRSRTLDEKTEAAIFRRAVEFTAFSTCVQSHGFVRNAYDFDADARSHYVRFMRLHVALGDYIDSLNRVAAETGVPPVRPLAFRNPEDPRTWNVHDEFLLGDAVLVAPTLLDGQRGDVYLPVGDWARVDGLDFPVYIDRSVLGAREITTKLEQE